jgi:hypothetical protein
MAKRWISGKIYKEHPAGGWLPLVSSRKMANNVDEFVGA